MTHSDDQPDLSAVPRAVAHNSNRPRLTLVWLVPLIAAVLGGWIALRAMLDHGPTITVSFLDAEGIEAGKTKVRYKNVDVGLVRTVTLGADRQTVDVTVEMAKSAREFLVSNTRFWVVRPRLGASGVSGLGTLLSGAYIGMDAGASGTPVRHFMGQETPPVVTGGAAGKRYVLQSRDVGSLGIGAPAYFHHIEVGRISSLTLNPDGQGVTLELFVAAPYDRFVTEDTRFWHASGVDVEVNSGGVHLQTESLTTILAGGVAFETPIGSTVTNPAPESAHFHLAPNHEAAMKAPDRVVETYILYFEDSLRGLAPGATVDFNGVDIGEVVALNVEYDRARERFMFPVLINVYPERVRSRYREGGSRPRETEHELVARMIEQGYRAQLRTSSLLTGQLYVALDVFPNAARVAPEPQQVPMPLPTVPGNLKELQATLLSVARKIDRMPLAKIGRETGEALDSLNRALGSTNTLVGNLDRRIVPAAESTLAQARLTLIRTQQALAPEDSLRSDLHDTLTSVARAADSIRVLADYMDRHPESLLRGKAEEPK